MISGCRKSWENKISTPVLKKLKTITSGSTTDTGDVIYQTTAFEYNSGGKLSRVISNVINSSPNHSDTTSYTYSRDTVFAVYKATGVYSDSHIIRNTGKQLIVLNSHGYISSNTRSINGQSDEIFKYQYDNSGYCTKMTLFDGPNQNVQWSADCKYSNGNMVSLSLNQGSQIISEEMTYYLDKINTISPDNTWFDYFGNENKNLIKTYRIVDNGNNASTFSYGYVFDANKYVTKRITIDDSGYIRWDRYTYQ
jgi:hypothetical protein